MLPPCRRSPLPLAQAPLWPLSPASGNASGAREAQIRGTRARARGYAASAPEHRRSGGLTPTGPFRFPEVCLSALGDSPLALPLPSSLPLRSRDIPAPAPSPSQPRRPGTLPSYLDLVLDSSPGLSALQGLKKLHFFRELFLRAPTPHGEPLPLVVPSSLRSGLPHCASRRRTSLADTHFDPRKVLPPSDTTASLLLSPLSPLFSLTPLPLPSHGRLWAKSVLF